MSGAEASMLAVLRAGKSAAAEAPASVNMSLIRIAAADSAWLLHSKRIQARGQ